MDLKNPKHGIINFLFLKLIRMLNQVFFGFPILLNKKYLGKRKKYLSLLDKSGVETRAIISGNFLNQPAIKLHKLGNKKDKFTQAQKIEDLGFFIGLHTEILNNKSLNKLVNILLKIDTL